MQEKRVRGWGLEYHSSEDEDYLPPGETSPQPKEPRTRRQQQHSSEEDVPLAQRRQALILKQQGQAQPNANATAQTKQISLHVPQEVLRNILQQACDRSGAIPTAAVAACVSRAWRDAVDSCPSLWQSLDLSFGWCRPTNAILTTQCHKWTAMRALNLAGCASVSEAGVAAIAAACPLLQDLNLASTTGLRDVGLADALVAMLMRPATEESQPLRSLNLSFAEINPKGSGINNVLRRVLLEQAKNSTEGPVLQTLIVEGCPALTHLPLRTAYDASVAAGKPLLSALRTLSLAGSAGSAGKFKLNLLRLQLASPNLESLDLSYLSRALGWEASISAAGVPDAAAAAAAWPRLRSCCITSALNTFAMFDMNILKQMISRSVAFEELRFVGIKGVYWDELAAALPPHASIKRLTLDGTYGAFEHRLRCAPTLSKLFSLYPWLEGSLEELSAVRCGQSLDDDTCKVLAEKFSELVRVDAQESVITDAGVKSLLASAKARGCAGSFELDISSCRGVGRTLRQAATRGMPELIAAVGL